MTTVPSQRRRTLIAAVIVALVVGASAWLLLRPTKPAPLPHEISPGMFAYDAEGFRYEYHAPTGREGLYDIAKDPNCLATVLKDHPDLAKRCREALAKDLNVERLDELQAKYAEEIKRLKALGYL
jgi:hypothetical protein